MYVFTKFVQFFKLPHVHEACIFDYIIIVLVYFYKVHKIGKLIPFCELTMEQVNSEASWLILSIHTVISVYIKWFGMFKVCVLIFACTWNCFAIIFNHTFQIVRSWSHLRIENYCWLLWKHHNTKMKINSDGFLVCKNLLGMKCLTHYALFQFS